MTDLDKQSVKELRRKAHDLNIKKWYSLKKAELIQAITDVKIITPEPEVYSNPPKEKVKDSPKRTVSWIVLIVLVITVPLLAWWISQPSSSWYQSVLNFLGF